MSIGSSFIPELEREAATTRHFLQRVPLDDPNWKPHPKSMSVGELTAHVATLPAWTAMMLRSEKLDVAPPGGEPMPQPPAPKTNEEAVETFDRNVADALSALAEADDATMTGDWELLKGGQRILKLPRAGLVRDFVLNHLIHHRAQLGVYLRMRDIPVPSSYGPTADEGGF